MTSGEMADSPYMIGFQYVCFSVSADGFFVAFLFLQTVTGLLKNISIGIIMPMLIFFKRPVTVCKKRNATKKPSALTEKQTY